MVIGQGVAGVDTPAQGSRIQRDEGGDHDDPDEQRFHGEPPRAISIPSSWTFPGLTDRPTRYLSDGASGSISPVMRASCQPYMPGHVMFPWPPSRNRGAALSPPTRTVAEPTLGV